MSESGEGREENYPPETQLLFWCLKDSLYFKVRKIFFFLLQGSHASSESVLLFFQDLSL